jgi:4-amino-4-deoxy-L-arabinose transferase-like glycosyltransferase
LLTGVVFSFAAGIIHPYYTVALAPAIAALVGIGSVMLWDRRSQLWVRVVLGATLALTGVWAYALLDRTPNWLPGLRFIVLVAGIGTGLVIAVAPRLRGRIAAAVVVVGLLAASLGPAAYAVDTIIAPHSGAIPAAGPATAGAFGGPGGGGPGGFAGRPGVGGAPGGTGTRPGAAGGRFPGTAGGAPPGAAGGFGRGFGRTNTGGAPGGGGGGALGILNASTPGAALVTALEKNAGQYTWVAATVSSNNASGYQLATGDPVMAIGGFNGTDPAPTLAQFEQYVQQGKIHYYIAGGRGGGGGTSSTTTTAASQITSWVESHFTAQTVSGQTIYNLTQSTSTTSASG